LTYGSADLRIVGRPLATGAFTSARPAESARRTTNA
jgi:hypothetical protein